MLVGMNGKQECIFRYPIAYFPLHRLSGILFKAIVESGIKLICHHATEMQVQIKLQYLSFDGDSACRAFVHKYCDKARPYLFQSMLLSYPTIVICDPEHLLKRLRNMLERSRLSSANHLMWKSNKVVWDFIIDLYKYQHEKLHVSVTKLTQEAVYLTSKSKMKTTYVSRVFSNRTVRSLSYFARLPQFEQQAGVVWFLERCIGLRKFFQYSGQIHTNSRKLHQALQDLAELKSWGQVDKNLLFDLTYTLHGFQYLSENTILKIIPKYIGTNSAENWFCKIRQAHGMLLFL